MTRSQHLPLKALAVAGFLGLAVAVAIYFLSLAGVQLIPSSSYDVTVVLPSAVSLAANADVLEDGVHVGQVRGIGTRGDDATVEIALNPRYAPIYRNAQVLIGDKTLDGENYVDLEPGTTQAKAVPNGGMLATPQPESTQIDQILSTLDPAHRHDLQTILDTLGRGIGGHGNALNAFLDGSASVVQSTLPVSQVLAGDDQQTAELIDDLGSVMDAIGARGAQIRVLVHQERILAQAVAARDARLDQTLADLPGFLHQAHQATSRLGTFSTTATPVIQELADATQALVPAITELRPAADATRTTMSSLQRFSAAATPMLDNLRTFAGVAVRLATPLETFLRQINPLESYLAPYASILGTVFSEMRAASEATDATGHYVRTQALVGLSSAVGVFTPEQEQAIHALLDAGVIGQQTDTLGSNAYPKPNGASRLTPYSGTYPRLQEDPPYTSTGRER